MPLEAKELSLRFPAFGTYLAGGQDKTVAAALVERDAAAGEVLLAEGSVASAVYLIADGAVAVTAGAPHPIEVGRFGAGAVLGEVSFLDGLPASATLTAVEPTRLYCMDRERFARLREEQPRAAAAFQRGLCRTLAARVREATDQLRSLAPGGPALKDAPRQRGFLEALRALFGSTRSEA